MINSSTTPVSVKQGIKEISNIGLSLDTQIGKEGQEAKTVLSFSISLTQSQSLKTGVHQLPKLSMRIRYLVHWFRIGLSIFLLLSVLLSLGGCSLNAATVTWNKAVDFVPSSVVRQVIVENTGLNPKASAENILAWKVTGKDGNFILFNFNTPDVCGVLGCLYAGYWFKKYQPITQVFLSYLNPKLPPGEKLLAVGNNHGLLLPCIIVMQTEKQQIRQLNYCFNGNHYQVADSQVFTNYHKLQR